MFNVHVPGRASSIEKSFCSMNMNIITNSTKNLVFYCSTKKEIKWKEEKKKERRRENVPMKYANQLLNQMETTNESETFRCIFFTSPYNSIESTWFMRINFFLLLNILSHDEQIRLEHIVNSSKASEGKKKKTKRKKRRKIFMKMFRRRR